MREDGGRDVRPDPDEILKKIKVEKTETAADGQRHGRLKIFFGYAAGVGKTYAMLNTAREDKNAGRDVVAGYVEPHARPDTMALLNGLETLAPKELEHKGIRLRELDIDAALARKAQIVLVDELAHTNADGCRHRKRYQDVKELLDAGIDVYTTVNVQHLESLRDIVAAITHIRVNERIPDRIFDEADKIELVDIEPEELLARLKAGKIYQGDQAGRAMQNFFTKENLTALREIALRRTADQVNRAVTRERKSGGRDYYTGEHVLVCLSPSPTNAKVIRTAARMAGAFRARLTAVVVKMPGEEEQDEAVKAAMEANIALAKQFEADVAVLYGEDIAASVADYAKTSGVSKIVIGRTVRPSGLGGIVHGRKNLIDRLIAFVPNMDIYVIPDVRASAGDVRASVGNMRASAGKKSRRKGRPARPKPEELALDIGGSVFCLALATVMGEGIEACGLGAVNQIMVYITAVLAVSGFARYRLTGAAVSAVCVLLFNFFFTEPKYSFRAVADIYPFTFLTMLICALTVSSLAGRLKKQVRLSKKEAEKMQILISVSNRLKMAADADEMLDICAKQVVKLLHRNVILYNAMEGKPGKKRLFLTDDAGEFTGHALLTDEEEAVASWVCKNCHRAGRTTNTLPGASGCYIPIQKDGCVCGVLGIEIGERGDTVSPDDKNVLHVILDETAAALKAQETQRRGFLC